MGNFIIFILITVIAASISAQQPTTRTTTTTTSTQTTQASRCQTSPRCENGWTSFGDKCLKLQFMAKSFVQAHDICRENFNSSLLIIQSEKEELVVQQLLIETASGKTGGTRWLWLGAVRCPHTGFYWLGVNQTEIPIGYQNWAPNQPDSMAGRGSEACVGIQLSNNGGMYGRWDDVACDAKLIFVCEKYLN